MSSTTVPARAPGRARNRWSRLLAAAAGALFVVGALVVPATPAAAAESDTLFSLLNSARTANGLAPLTRNAAMDQVAANWAAHLAQTGTLAHNPSYSSQIPGGWSRAAENVAQGYPDAGSMHAGWMGSSGHRANILGNYSAVGVAFVTGGGTTWGVEVFALYSSPAPPPPPPPPAAAPAPAAPAPAAAEAPAQSKAAPPAEEPAKPAADSAPQPEPTPPSDATDTAWSTASFYAGRAMLRDLDPVAGPSPQLAGVVSSGVLVLGLVIAAVTVAVRRRIR